MTKLPIVSEQHIDPYSYPDKLRQTLSVLHIESVNARDKWMSAADISKTLRERSGIRLHWHSIHSLFSGRRDLVDRKRVQRRWHYCLLAAGRNYLNASASPILLIDPANAMQAVASLHDILAGLTGPVSLCDPYVDDVTLEHLDSCPRDNLVRILTSSIRDTGKMRRLLAAAHVAGPTIKIGVVPTPTLHDRYVIDTKSMMILGTSLNGFGKKQCFVIRAGADTREVMLREFDTLWNSAKSWP